MKKIVCLLLSIFFLMYACKKEYSTIDGSSQQSFDQSLESITSKLTILQQDKILEAVKLIYKFNTSRELDEKNRWKELYKLLNGKKAEQIFDLAEELAKENKIAWSGTSMNTLNSSVFEDEIKPLSDEEKKIKQIESATRINLRFSPVSAESDMNDGFVLYPNLVDDADHTVIYFDLPLEFSISFINEGTVIYVTKRTASSSNVGDPALKKGLKIPFSMFDKDKLSNANVDVEIRANIGEKYLYGKLSNIPIDLSKTKEASNSIEEELNGQMSLDNVKSFIQFIGKKEYSKAYALTKNPKWDTEEKFASTSNGFGTIEQTNLLTVETIKSAKSQVLIFALYQIRDNQGKVKTLKQNFIVKKIENNWLITDMETKERKEDSWKEN